jgi:hypothetical protein
MGFRDDYRRGAGAKEPIAAAEQAAQPSRKAPGSRAHSDPFRPGAPEVKGYKMDAAAHHYLTTSKWGCNVALPDQVLWPPGRAGLIHSAARRIHSK